MSTPKVIVFDTTLRDGEQSPGATMNAEEKLEVARSLAALGVDVIEAGFPAASPDDLRAVMQIAQTVGQADGAPIICGLARAARRDIECCWEAVRHAKRPRIHTFLATSPIHREHKLKMSREEVLDRIRDMVGFARSLCDDVEFSPEDAARTEIDFLYRALEVAIEAGATTVNVPDTVGYTTPQEFGARIAAVHANVAGIENVVVSVHCHNDLGMATANTLAGVQAGARQVEVTINGIGERAGNTALEEVVMALHTRRAHFGVHTDIDTTRIAHCSRLVSRITGMAVQPNKAVVGANAFAHEAGIHQDGMLKNAETYEIMRPETVGASGTLLVLGKHSGRHAFAARLKELGHPLAPEDLNVALAQFKRLADRKKVVSDAELIALVTSEVYQPRDRWSLLDLQVGCGTVGMPTATVRLQGPDGASAVCAGVGTGPIEAVFEAVNGLTNTNAVLQDYTVNAVTAGRDALGEVSVRVGTADLGDDRTWHGHGADQDVIVASCRAYLAAINRLLAARERAVAAPSVPAPR
ncbi:MAG: 2-isopropylmalate synthase [Myxococcota bacterium]|jgi:2-isopropylmalate synthase